MFIDLLRKRRSIRSFDPRPVEGEKVDLLIEALLRSPTSKGRHPWEFILITDPDMTDILATAKSKGGFFLAGAPLCVVICGDPSISDVWIEDCAVAATMLQLAAEDLGLGSCWSQIRRRQHESGVPSTKMLRRHLHLPENLEVASIIGVGYPDCGVSPRCQDPLPAHKVHRNTYHKNT
jgi:nitroreductase